MGRVWSKIDVASLVNWTLKLTVFQVQTNGVNLFFACWCKRWKAKSYFTDFWIGMVKSGCGHLFHETRKCAVSQELVYELS